MEDIRWFIPTIKEAILFIMILFLLILTMNLYHNNTIQLIVNNISRCIRDAKIANSSNNIYTVTAVNRLKVPLFDITYDLNAKTYNTKCRLPTGNVVNNFNQQIPVYDFVEKQTAAQLIDVPPCNSDKDYTSILYRPFTYIGYSPLVNFITSKGVITDMFDGNGGLGGGGSGVTRCSASVINRYISENTNSAVVTVGSGGGSGTDSAASAAAASLAAIAAAEATAYNAALTKDITATTNYNNAISTNLKTVIDRLNSIYYGYNNPGQVGPNKNMDPNALLGKTIATTLGNWTTAETTWNNEAKAAGAVFTNGNGGGQWSVPYTQSATAPGETGSYTEAEKLLAIANMVNGVEGAREEGEARGWDSSNTMSMVISAATIKGNGEDAYITSLINDRLSTAISNANSVISTLKSINTIITTLTTIHYTNAQSAYTYWNTWVTSGNSSDWMIAYNKSQTCLSEANIAITSANSIVNIGSPPVLSRSSAAVIVPTSSISNIYIAAVNIQISTGNNIAAFISSTISAYNRLKNPPTPPSSNSVYQNDANILAMALYGFQQVGFNNFNATSIIPSLIFNPLKSNPSLSDSDIALGLQIFSSMICEGFYNTLRTGTALFDQQQVLAIALGNTIINSTISNINAQLTRNPNNIASISHGSPGSPGSPEYQLLVGIATSDEQKALYTKYSSSTTTPTTLTNLKVTSSDRIGSDRIVYSYTPSVTLTGATQH